MSSVQTSKSGGSALSPSSGLDHRHRCDLPIGSINASSWATLFKAIPYFLKLRTFHDNTVTLSLQWACRVVLPHQELSLRVNLRLVYLNWQGHLLVFGSQSLLDFLELEWLSTREPRIWRFTPRANQALAVTAIRLLSSPASTGYHPRRAGA